MQPTPFNTPTSGTQNDEPPVDDNVREQNSGVTTRDVDNSDFKGEDRVDLGNHEADDYVEPPHINEKGELVDADGKKVFTTNEEALKDGSMVLDRKGRQPGIYLDDLEEEQNELRRKRYEEAYGQSTEGTHSVVERQVNVVNSPLPPVTTVTRQEHPLTQETDSELEKDNVDRSVHLDHNSDVVAESETEKVQ